MTDHRQLGVDIDRAGPRHQEKARLEVLQVVDRQRREPLAIDRQHPPGQKARVEREQPGRVSEGGLDVAALIAHHKGIAIEDPDLGVGHREPSAPRIGGRSRGGGPGKIRWIANSSSTSPVHTSAPRSTAAIAFSSPRHTRSNSARSARIVHSAGPPWCDTVVSPLSTATSHRSVRPPSTRSKRTRPVTFARSGSWPRRPSSSKNSTTSSLISRSLPVPFIIGYTGAHPWTRLACSRHPDHAPGYGQTLTSRPWTAIAQMTNTSTAMMSSAQNG